MSKKNNQWYIRGVIDKNRRILAKTITLIESSLPIHRQQAQEIINSLLPKTGKSIRVGITGVPGAGKSTFIESLGVTLLKKGHSVAVLAVDPSSTRSGGSILADKTRMEKLSTAEGAYIRPSPSGGTLGGVAEKTRETMLVCEAAGFDIIIVETVGVGQSETVVSSMVDFFLVLLIAGGGDELQGIKKGVLEIADTLAINKADGNNAENAQKARDLYDSAFHLLNPASRTWSPKVLTCSAVEFTGIDIIWETILEHRKLHMETGEFEDKRKKQVVQWMWSIIDNGLKEWFYNKIKVKDMLPELIKDVETGSKEPTIAASQILHLLLNELPQYKENKIKK